jgi:iron-sulfur cluster assembly protein/iron-sulfur cluster insertion protein
MSTPVSLGGVRTKAPDTIVLSDAASAKVAELLAAEDDKSLVLRVAVRPGGCSGFSYEMFFDSEVTDDDKVEEFKGVKVAVDAASASHLKGATLDYKDALQGGGFSINNPNAERTCGCGQSFS